MQVCVERDFVSCCEWGVCACVEGLKKRISRCSVDLFCPIFTLYSMSAMVPNAVAPQDVVMWIGIYSTDPKDRLSSWRLFVLGKLVLRHDWGGGAILETR